MSKIDELKRETLSPEAFGDNLYDMDKNCGAEMSNVLTRIQLALFGAMGNPSTVYLVTLTGRNALTNEAWMTAHEWCLEHVTQVHGKVRGYAAVSKLGLYYFLKHEDAMAFFFTFGDAFN